MLSSYVFVILKLLTASIMAYTLWTVENLWHFVDWCCFLLWLLWLFISYWILKSTPNTWIIWSFHLYRCQSFIFLYHLGFWIFYSFIRLHETRNKTVRGEDVHKKIVFAFILKCMCLCLFSVFSRSAVKTELI